MKLFLFFFFIFLIKSCQIIQPISLYHTLMIIDVDTNNV